MKVILEAVTIIKKVYQYEKTLHIDRQILQIVMGLFSIVLLLIDIKNLLLGKYVIGLVTMAAALVGLLMIVFLQFCRKNADFIFKILVLLLLLMAVPIAVMGGNDGFSLLWYIILPVVAMLLLGMPYGVPLCAGFGLAVSVLFWTPLHTLAIYRYPDDYRLYYPFFYWFFCLLVLVMDIFHKFYQMQQLENEKNLENEVREAVEKTKGLMVASVAAISHILDEKDAYTQEHSKRVAKYAKLIAQNMQNPEFTQEEILHIYTSALMHDIGKIAIPDDILNKPARLTDEEYEIMKKHTIWGREILSGLEFLPQADLGASYHHERYDGKGYPYGMLGEDLPMMARIISAADALDAMSSNRCYRKHCEESYIIGEFEKGAGKQFDAKVAQTVVALIKEGRIVV